MHKIHAISGWTGTSMIGIILAFLPNYLSHPSDSVLRVMIGCGVGSAICFAVWFFTHEKPTADRSQATHGANSPIAGRDLKQIKATNYYEAAAPTPPPPQPLPTPPKQQPVQLWESPPKPIARVEIGNIEWVKAMFQHNMWRLTEYNGEQCLVVSVFNPPPPLHHQTSTINPLSAHLLFREGNEVLANVAKAFWISRPYNEISIEIGDRAYLVVATLEKDVLTAIGNRDTAPQGGSPMFSRTIPRPTVDSMRIKQSLSIEITLLVNRTAIGKFCIDARREEDGTILFERSDQ